MSRPSIDLTGATGSISWFPWKSRRGWVPYRDRVRSLLDFISGATDEHWVRVVVNRETRRLVENMRPEKLKVLEISGDYWGRQRLFKEYRSVNYPEYDVCESVLPETFDLIIAEHVFNHLLWPYRAAANVHDMLNPSGHLLVTTSFLIRVNRSPEDCTRWTETGLRYFLAEAGFPLRTIQTGSWGNRACIKANFTKWARYRSKVHSLRNEPDFPGVVWALARK